MGNMRSFAIKELGCKVNQYESQVIRENLNSAGFKETDETMADVVVVNSCTVTGQADRKTCQLIRRIKKNNEKAKVIVTGCFAELEADISRIKAMPEVHDVVSNKNKFKIPELVIELFDGIEDERCLVSGVSGFNSHTRAFVKVQDGCDQVCTYCKVRLVRGNSVSRDISSILLEIETLVKNGYKELVITGICLGSWKGAGGEDLSDLVYLINDLEGNFRIRLSSIEPNQINEKLIKAVSSSEKICEHFHIPLQSGSDRILALMKRRYNSGQYSEIIRSVREIIPCAGISMDVIVGFPGEEEKDFDKTMSLIRELNPSRLHVFGYSERAGTLSFEMKNKVSRELMKGRVEKLIKLGDKLQVCFAERFIDKHVEVLVESKVKSGKHSGYTREYVQVTLPGEFAREGEIFNIVPKNIDTANKCLDIDDI